MTLGEKVESLLNHGRYFHHVSIAAGYVSRKTDGYLQAYSGKFGTGTVWHTPSWDSNSSHYVVYLIKEEKMEARRPAGAEGRKLRKEREHT